DPHRPASGRSAAAQLFRAGISRRPLYLNLICEIGNNQKSPIKIKIFHTMPEALTFMMGKFAAVLPGELRYARNHMWCRPTAGGLLRFGFTAYAVRLMQDVYFLDWSVNAGDALQLRQTIGHIETSKAQSDLFAPIAGKLIVFNQALLEDPSGINVDN